MDKIKENREIKNPSLLQIHLAPFLLVSPEAACNVGKKTDCEVSHHLTFCMQRRCVSRLINSEFCEKPWRISYLLATQVVNFSSVFHSSAYPSSNISLPLGTFYGRKQDSHTGKENYFKK